MVTYLFIRLLKIQQKNQATDGVCSAFGTRPVTCLQHHEHVVLLGRAGRLRALEPWGLSVLVLILNLGNDGLLHLR